MNSIMFPPILSLACKKLPDLSHSLAFAMIRPIACYAIIARFGIFARRPA